MLEAGVPGAPRLVRALGLCLLLALVVRLPYFFPAVIDWDEGTFILMGQSMLDGHLPYVQLWDAKPPLLFGFFAAVIGVLGDSIVAVRFAGTLCVALTAWLVYVSASIWWSRPAGWFAAGLWVVLGSVIASGQATMSEHVMLPPFLTAVHLWLRTGHSRARLFWIGVLIAAAVLIRLNVGLTAILLGVLLGADAFRRGRSVTGDLGAYALGALATAAVVALPYAFAGRLTLLWQGGVVAPLIRSDSATAFLDRLPDLANSAGPGLGDPSLLGLALFVWFGAAAGLILAVSIRHGPARRGLGSMAILALGTIAGVAMSGDANEHYFIQLVPFAVIFAAALVHLPPRPVRGLVWALAAVVTAAAARPIAMEYRTIVSRVLARQDLAHGPAYDIAAQIRRINPDHQPILLLTNHHVAYWFTRAHPPTPFVTHPSSLQRGAVLAAMGTTSREQLIAIFQQEPELVAIDSDPWFLNEFDRAWLASALSADYLLAATIEGTELYRRNTPRFAGGNGG